MPSFDDPGVAMHNDLYNRLQAVASRFHTSIQIPGPFLEGAPGHVETHNANGRAMLHLRDVANSAGVGPVVITLPYFVSVGDTGHLDDHDLHETALATLEAVEMPWE